MTLFDESEAYDPTDPKHHPADGYAARADRTRDLIDQLVVDDTTPNPGDIA